LASPDVEGEVGTPVNLVSLPGRRADLDSDDILSHYKQVTNSAAGPVASSSSHSSRQLCRNQHVTEGGTHRMSEMASELLVLKDEAGNYYALSREMIERVRVPDDQKATVQQLVDGDVADFGGQVNTQPIKFSLVGSFGLTAGAKRSVVHAAGYYFQFFQFQDPAAGK
jgi:hypothetical protein